MHEGKFNAMYGNFQAILESFYKDGYDGGSGHLLDSYDGDDLGLVVARCVGKLACKEYVRV